MNHLLSSVAVLSILSAITGCLAGGGSSEGPIAEEPTTSAPSSSASSNVSPGPGAAPTQQPVSAAQAPAPTPLPSAPAPAPAPAPTPAPEPPPSSGEQVAVSVPAPAPPPNPAWIAGYYSNPGERTNNSATGEVSLNLSSSGSYSYSACRSCTNSSGKWAVTSGNVLSFTGGLLGGDQINLTSSMTPNCRILNVDGAQIWKASVVEGCPFQQPTLTSSECSVAGTYRKTSGSDGISFSYSTVETITLDPDHFYMTTYETNKTYCTDYSCSSFFTGYKPTVGTWSASSRPSTTGYSRTKSASCTGSSSGGSQEQGAPLYASP